MAKRELSKCRVWERERRDRLKSCFDALGKLLPCYDPSSTLSKIEILQRAAALVLELQVKNRDLLSDAASSAEVQRADEVRRLHDRVKKLLARNEQLYGLLQSAGIRVPSECGTAAAFRQTRKWSSKISPDAADGIVKKLAEAGESRGTRAGPGGGDATRQKRRARRKGGAKRKPGAAPNENVDVSNKQKPKVKQTEQKRNGNAPSRSGGGAVGRPVYTSPSLGPGTLILADGSVLPVVTRPPPPATTVILMHRSRPIACRPPAAAKVPIPRCRPVPRLPHASVTKQRKARTKSTPPDPPAAVPDKIVESVDKICGETATSVTAPEPANDTVETLKVTAEKVSAPVEIPSEQTADSNKDEVKPSEEPAPGGNPESEENTEVVVPREPETPAQEPPKETSVDPTEPPSETGPKDRRRPQQQQPQPQELPQFSFGGGDANEAGPKETTPPTGHSELSDDIFASLSVPAAGGHAGGGHHHPESMSPTAAFLLAFPLVSTLTGGGAVGGGTSGGARPQDGPVGEDNSDSRQDTPTLLQIGAIDGSPRAGHAAADIGLDSFSSFFASASAVAPQVTSDVVSSASAAFYTSVVAISAADGPSKCPQRKRDFEQPPEEAKRPRAFDRKHYGAAYGAYDTPKSDKQPYQQQQQQQMCTAYNPFSDNGVAVPYQGGGCPTGYDYGGFQQQQQQQQQEQCAKRTTTDKHVASVPFGYESEKRAARPTVNWMTAPDARHQPPVDQPAASSVSVATGSFPPIEFGTGSIFGGGHQWSAQEEPRPKDQHHHAHHHQQQQCGAYGGGRAGGDDEANRFSWSPGRLLPPLIGQENPGGGLPVPSTLPTLVGDLALGTTPGTFPPEEPAQQSRRSAARRKHQLQLQPPPVAPGYDVMHPNSFSVSQLVDQQHKDDARRRGKGSAVSPAASSSSTRHHHAHGTAKRKSSDSSSCYRQATAASSKWPQQQQQQQQQSDTNKRYKHGGNVPAPSSYSAEALIGGNPPNQQPYRQPQQHQQQYQGAAAGHRQPPPPFPPPPHADPLHVPYFPEQHHGYGAPFAGYPSATAYPTAANVYEYGDAKEEQRVRSQCPPPPPPPVSSSTRSRHSTSGRPRSTRHAQQTPVADATVPPYVDLSFLSMPATIGSPLLPDDCSAAAPFLSNPPFYRHYGAGSPTTNTSSLTNFNLSTIFPEMGAKYAGGSKPRPPDVKPVPPPSTAYVTSSAFVDSTPFSNA